MAVLHIGAVPLRDAEMRKRAGGDQNSNSERWEDFDLFQGRMDKLAKQIRLAHEEAEDVNRTSRRITTRFETDSRRPEFDDPEQSGNVCAHAAKPLPFKGEG